MIIRPSYFENGGEVDISAHYSGYVGARWRRYGRLSIRKAGEEYEVYVKWHGSSDESSLMIGPLHECIFFTNRETGGVDTVEDG